MALNFGSSGLFPSTGLLNDDGLLKERWDQEGSSLKEWTTVDSAGSHNLYTVPAKKKVFITQLTCSSSVARFCSLRRGTTIIVTLQLIGQDSHSYTFGSPVEFTAGQIVNVNQQADLTSFVAGWEENA